MSVATPNENMEPVSIRPMTLADLDQVVAIDQASFSLPWPRSAYLYELKDNPLSLLWVAESRSNTQHQPPASELCGSSASDPGRLKVNEMPGHPAGDPGKARAVIESKGQVVGIVVIWLVVDEAHIATIAVSPERRGQGIAHQLMAVALQGAIQKGMRSATLEVRAGNQSAQHLYRDFRFEVVGTRPRYYRDDNEDALIMTIGNLDQAYQEWLEGKARIRLE